MMDIEGVVVENNYSDVSVSIAPAVEEPVAMAEAAVAYYEKAVATFGTAEDDSPDWPLEAREQALQRAKEVLEQWQSNTEQ